MTTNHLVPTDADSPLRSFEIISIMPWHHTVLPPGVGPVSFLGRAANPCCIEHFGAVRCSLMPMTIDERLTRYLGKDPIIHESAYIAQSAVIIGDVRIGPHASVWPGCILRGDIETIEIGEGTNIQDGTIIHLADDFGTWVGRYVTVGHGAILHACTVEDECLIGMRATILDGAVIGARSIVAAGALVPKGMRIPPCSLVVGLPAKVVRQLTPDEELGPRKLSEKYVTVAEAHRARDRLRN